MPQRPARTTRRVAIEDLADLVAAPRHATIAFLIGDELRAAPVRAIRRGDSFLVGLGTDETRPDLGTVATLLLDEGVFTSQLRGVRIRGTVRESQHDVGDLTWFDLACDHVVAWDYGHLRPTSS